MSEEKLTYKCFQTFLKFNPFAPVLGLSNEVVCILVAQESAELPSIKVGGLKKNPAFQPDLHHSSAAQVRVPDLFFSTSNFDLW